LLEGDRRKEVAMFSELPLSGPDRKPTRTRWTFLLSLGGELTVLTVLLLIPLIYVQVLPYGWRETSIAPPPSAPPQVSRAVARSTTPARNAFTIPAFIPPHALIVRESRMIGQSTSSGAGTNTIPGSILGTGNGTRWNSLFSQAKPEPPPASPQSGGPSRIKVGGIVQQAKLLQMVRPIYPPLAREARIQGTVVLAAVIGTDGTVRELHYISGPPLLVQAAMEAVRQWLYKPTRLNGRPVTVETTIKVIFTLGNTGGGGPERNQPRALAVIGQT
jgi:protein TonB